MILLPKIVGHTLVFMLPAFFLPQYSYLHSWPTHVVSSQIKRMRIAQYEQYLQ